MGLVRYSQKLKGDERSYAKRLGKAFMHMMTSNAPIEERPDEKTVLWDLFIHRLMEEQVKVLDQKQTLEEGIGAFRSFYETFIESDCRRQLTYALLPEDVD